jgi:hypothetical protein
MLERVQRYGVRVICSRCGQEGRHFQARGRLRTKDGRCPACDGRRRPRWWILRFPERWESEVMAERAIAAPFAHRELARR